MNDKSSNRAHDQQDGLWLRVDRMMRRQFKSHVEPEPATAFAAPSAAQGGRAALPSGLKATAKRMVRRPLIRLRSFFLAPFFERTDSMQQVLQRHSGDLARLDRLQQHLEQLDARLEHLTVALSVADRHITFLHTKADELARKTRPALRLGDAYAMPLEDGYLFVPASDEGLLLMYAGAGSDGLEPGTRAVIQKILPAGGHAIDVGASVGLHLITMARAVGATGSVSAFEAEPRLGPVLARTLSVNGFGHVNLHNVAIGDRDGEITFNISRTIGHSSIYDLGEEGSSPVTVPIRKLDSVIAPGTATNLIKIDVEGAELDVIRGARRLLSDSPECAIIAECGPSHLARIGIDIETWLAEFSALGFRPYAIAEPTGETVPASPDWIARQHSVNLVFVQPDSAPARLIAGGK